MQKTYKIRYSSVAGLKESVGLLLVFGLPIVLFGLIALIFFVIQQLHHQGVVPFATTDIINWYRELSTEWQGVIVIMIIVMLYATGKVVHNAFFLKELSFEEVNATQMAMTIGKQREVFNKRDVKDVRVEMSNSESTKEYEGKIYFTIAHQPYTFVIPTKRDDVQEIYRILSKCERGVD